MAILRAAVAAGVERSVYCSSVAALGLNADGTPADETTPVREEMLVGIYKRSKYRAEQAVMDLVRQGMDVVIVNPSAPVGPRDIKPTPTGRMILDAAAGRVPAYVDTGLNMVHVDDVAEGHALALERGRAGEKYILGGENFRLRDLLALVAASRAARAPDPAADRRRLAGRDRAEAVARLTGKEPLVTRDHRRWRGRRCSTPRQGHARARLRAAPGADGGGGCGGVVPRRGHAAHMTRPGQ